MTTQSGRIALLNVAPGASINTTVEAAVGGAVIMGSNSTLTGMTINAWNGAGISHVYGVEAGTGASGAAITNNVISATSSTNNAFGVRLIPTTGILVSGNTITASRPGNSGFSIGMIMADGSSATVTGNSFAAYSISANPVALRWSGTALSGSTGNVLVNGQCVVTGVHTGTIGFTDGSTCP